MYLTGIVNSSLVKCLGTGFTSMRISHDCATHVSGQFPRVNVKTKTMDSSTMLNGKTHYVNEVVSIFNMFLSGKHSV